MMHVKILHAGHLYGCKWLHLFDEVGSFSLALAMFHKCILLMNNVQWDTPRFGIGCEDKPFDSSCEFVSFPPLLGIVRLHMYQLSTKLYLKCLDYCVVCIPWTVYIGLFMLIIIWMYSVYNAHDMYIFLEGMWCSLSCLGILWDLFVRNTVSF